MMNPFFYHPIQGCFGVISTSFPESEALIYSEPFTLILPFKS